MSKPKTDTIAEPDAAATPPSTAPAEPAPVAMRPADSAPEPVVLVLPEDSVRSTAQYLQLRFDRGGAGHFVRRTRNQQRLDAQSGFTVRKVTEAEFAAEEARLVKVAKEAVEEQKRRDEARARQLNAQTKG